MGSKQSQLIIPAENLGTLIIILAAIEIIGSIIILCIDSDADKVVYGGSVVLGIIFAASGYGVSKGNHVAYWIALVFSVLALVSGILEICVAAGLNIDGVSKSWVSAFCGTLVGLILTGNVLVNKKQILG